MMKKAKDAKKSSCLIQKDVFTEIIAGLSMQDNIGFAICFLLLTCSIVMFKVSQVNPAMICLHRFVDFEMDLFLNIVIHKV